MQDISKQANDPLLRGALDLSYWRYVMASLHTVKVTIPRDPLVQFCIATHAGSLDHIGRGEDGEFGIVGDQLPVSIQGFVQGDVAFVLYD